VPIELLLALGAFGATLVRLIFSWRAHRERNRERAARARFEVTVPTVDADEEGSGGRMQTRSTPGSRSASRTSEKRPRG
jgi:hypothetical protein